MNSTTLRLIVFASLALLLLTAGMSSAQENASASTTANVGAWPVYSASQDHSIERGPGGYLSIVKLVLLWIVLLVWVRAADWVNRDCYAMRMNYAIWNSVVVFPFLIGFLVFALGIPIFFIGFIFLLLTTGGPFVTYVVVRNRKVSVSERVFTPEHFRHLLAGKAKKIGVTIDSEKKAEHEKGAPVQFTAIDAPSDKVNQANGIVARQSLGYVPAKELIADAIDHRGERILLDYTPEAVGTQYQVDGFWHVGKPRDREEGDVILAVLKKLANLDINERRARQEGKIAIEYDNTKYIGFIVCQGTKTGERVALHLSELKQTFAPLVDLGMRAKSVDKLKEALAKKTGLVLLSGMPSGGLTALTVSALHSTDRLMRDFAGVDEAVNPEPDIENVDITICGADQTPAALLPDLIRKEPEVLFVPNLSDVETARILCEEANDDRLIITSIRAKEAVEALLRVLLLKTPAREFATAVTTVVNVRLVRKLCDSCKEGYTPEASLLKKLGIPADRVAALYRPRQPDSESSDGICEKCQGVGYFGRTGIYEFLSVDDRMRQALVKEPKLEVLRSIARKAGNSSLQEEGIVLVVKGITSLPELTRVLKQ